MQQRAEKSYKSEALSISTGILASLLLLFAFLFLEAPDPPLTKWESWGGGGVVLNIGDIYAGTGDPTNLKPTDLNASENPENASLDNQLADNSSQPVETEEMTPTEDPEAVAITTKDKLKEKNKTDNKVDKKDNKNNNTNNTTTVTNNTNQQKIDNKAIFTGTTQKAGDDNNKAGDPGNPKGIDQNALYKDGVAGKGSGGLGDGTGPSIGGGIAGWKYIGNPVPKDDSQDKGTLEYKIFVNDDGTVAKIVLMRNLGISPKTEKLYRDQLQTLLFDPEGKVAPITEGTVTYKINVK
jgi:outer membrane biosynthesis protein TonB